MFLPTVVFCLLAACTKPVTPPVVNNGGGNNDTTMTDTTIIDTTMIDTTTHTDTTRPTGNYTWLALGDSYTIGQSVGEGERFPAQAIAMLQADSLVFDTPQYIATTGWTTTNLLNAIALQNPQGPFEIVTLLIGVNDQYQRLDISTYDEQFTACLENAIALAGNRRNRVFVLSIPDYSVTPFAQYNDTARIRWEIDAYNAINKAIAASYNITYIDITEGTRAMKQDATLIAWDGLHPSGKEYAKWAALLAPEIAKALK